MTTEAILADFRSLVSQMMKEKGIEEYDVDLTGNSNIGDGYMGDIIFFKVNTHFTCIKKQLTHYSFD